MYVSHFYEYSRRNDFHVLLTLKIIILYMQRVISEGESSDEDGHVQRRIVTRQSRVSYIRG